MMNYLLRLKLTDILLFLILLALIGGGALVGNFLLMLGGIILAIILFAWARGLSRKAWIRIGLVMAAIVVTAIAIPALQPHSAETARSEDGRYAIRQAYGEWEEVDKATYDMANMSDVQRLIYRLTGGRLP